MQSSRNCTVATLAASAVLAALLVSPVLTRSSHAQQIAEEDERRNARKQQLVQTEKGVQNRKLLKRVEDGEETLKLIEDGHRLVSIDETVIPIDDSEIVWIRSYDEAIAQAKLTGKPLFLEFRCVP